MLTSNIARAPAMNLSMLIHRLFFGYDVWGAVRLGDTYRSLSLVSKTGAINAVNKDHETLLTIALRYRRLYIAAKLIAQGADVNLGTRAGWTPLMSASLHGYVELVSLMLDRGANVNAVTVAGQTAIQAAAVNGHDECVQQLAEHGANLTAVEDRLGYSPLMIAIGECSAETISLLIALGSDPNAISKDRMTPLRCAQQKGRADITQILANAGATL